MSMTSGKIYLYYKKSKLSIYYKFRYDWDKREKENVEGTSQVNNENKYG